MITPPNFANWNRALRGAYLKGWNSYGSGYAITACPYSDMRKGSGQLTWSRSFIKAWQYGWNDSKQWIESSPHLHVIKCH